MTESGRHPRSAVHRMLALTSTMVVVFLAVVSVTVVYVLGLPEEYTGRSIVQFGSRPTLNGGLAGATSVEAAAAGYVAFISAPSTLTSVADAIGVDRSELRDGLAVNQLPATSTIEIAYTSLEARNAAVGANALAETVAQRTNTDPVVYAEVLAEAAVPVNPSGPRRQLMLGAGVLLGALAAAGVGTVAWSASGVIGSRSTARAPADVTTTTGE